MSGGGASPSIKNKGIWRIALDGPAEAVMLTVGGRTRVCVKKDANGNLTKKLNLQFHSLNNRYFTETTVENLYGQSLEKLIDLVKIFGANDYEIKEDTSKLSYCGENIDANADFYFDKDIYKEVGFVEGVARITTPVGEAACVVKNGTLYPILTEYDQATEDNWTLQDVYLNGDNEVSNLQQMVDRSGTYLAYTEDQEADKWSPIENYLHMHVKMPIVPKIGFVPAQQIGLGDVLPGLNYAVTL